jgi:hypothetical protein
MAALPAIAVIATLASSGFAMYSANEQGKAQEGLANYNADLAEQDAMVEERDARLAANEQRKDNERLLSRQRALYAKAGVVTTAGSPLLVQAETAGILERNALATEVAGSNQAGVLRQQGVLERFAGKSARSAGRLNAIGTGLQGVASASGQASKYWPSK